MTFNRKTTITFTPQEINILDNAIRLFEQIGDYDNSDAADAGQKVAQVLLDFWDAWAENEDD